MSDKYIYIKSYGCQMTVYDSNRIKDLFSNKGYKITKDISKADLTVLNTCHIREKAVEKVYSDIGRVKKIKDKKQNMKLVVAGCVAQAEGLEIKKRAIEAATTKMAKILYSAFKKAKAPSLMLIEMVCIFSFPVSCFLTQSALKSMKIKPAIARAIGI